MKKVGEGVRRSISESIDTTGKAVAAVAGLGVFFFAMGYFVEWQRLKRVHLPSEEILPLISKGQVAAAGVRELIVSLVFGAVTLAVLGGGLVYLARLTQGREGGLAVRINRLCSREIAAPTAVVGVLTLLLVPFTLTGVLVAATLTGLLWYGLVLVHRYLDDGTDATFPLWPLSIAIAVATVVLTGARQWEFPQTRPVTRITFKDEAKSGPPIGASYIASDSDKILLGVPFSGDEDRERLLILGRDELEQVWLEPGRRILPEKPSLLDDAVGLLVPDSDFQLSCVPPECRIGQNDELGPSDLF